MEKIMDPIIVESSKPATHAIIWLHGLGADGYDFSPMAAQFQQLLTAPIRFIFPHAPLRSVTLNGGYVMRAWYDITGLDLNAREDRSGLNETAATLDQLIQQQSDQGIPSERIFLAGFSQGCASVLYAGLRYPKRLAGIIGFSGYLPFYRTLAQEANSANLQTPIFLSHGLEDTVVPLLWAELSRKVLQEQNYPLSWHTYPMAHQVCNEQILDLAKWTNNLMESQVTV
jgi:phospholipase/carboxylesterase